jgi:fatty-acyl-CoA synthase
MLRLTASDTLGSVISGVAVSYPKNEAIVAGKQRITYDVLMDRADSMANALLKLGVKKGDKVAIWMGNKPEWVYVNFACIKIGAPLVPLNTRYKAHELEHILGRSDSTTLFMMDHFINIDYVPMINDVCPELKDSEPGQLDCESLPFLKRIIMFGERHYPGMLDYYTVLDSGQDYAKNDEFRKAREAVKPEDVYIIPYTSGTTGFPKGVVTTHYQYLRAMEAFSTRLNMSDRDRILVVSPFSHNMGNMTGMLLGACNGACILPMESFDPGEALRLIHEEGVTKFAGSPTMYTMMLDHPDFPKRDTTSIRSSIIGAADVSPDLVRTIMERMGIKDLISAYGLTENTGVSTMTQPGDAPEVVAHTSGRLIFHDCELKVLNPDTGEEVPRGTQGEICSRGFYVLQEYYKMPEETAAAIDSEGWFHTGDLGIMDERDYIKITGRLKDMFITGGVNAYPAEIENYLLTHPKVSIVSVVGVPDRRMGEVAMAFVKLKPGETATQDEIIGFARERMANYKAPKYVKFVDDYPMTATGKVQKFALREMAVKELGLDAQ